MHGGALCAHTEAGGWLSRALRLGVRAERLAAQGLAWSSLGWILLGLSQLAVVHSMDDVATAQAPAFDRVPVITAAVALATVARFVVAVMPGGLGVREGVLMSALAPALGPDRSVVVTERWRG